MPRSLKKALRRNPFRAGARRARFTSIPFPYPITRRSRLLRAVLSIVLVSLVGCGERDAAAPAEIDLAIVNANVVPMDSERVLASQTVLIADGVITQVGPSAQIDTAGAARVIDAGGAYVVPGLADMHVHVWSESDLVPYVANGVTLVRNMWGSPAHLDYRARVLSGELFGPTIVTAGPIVDGEPPVWDGSTVATSPAEGRRIVQEQKAAGYDFVKIYDRLEPEVFEAILDEARSLDIPVAGHVPTRVPLFEALESGMASIEHMTGFITPTLTRPDVLPTDNVELARLARSLESGRTAISDIYDDDKFADVIAAAAESDVWQVPTLIVHKRVWTSRRQAAALMERPGVRFMSPVALASWNPDTDFRMLGLSDDDMEALQYWFEMKEQRVGAMNEAGVRILAGTDAPNPHVLHGFSLHEELALLHEAGLSNYQALLAATRSPAEFLGQEDEFGTVAAGMRADLVLAPANPFDDLSALAQPIGVVLRGTWYARAQLDAALEEVAESYRTPTDWFAGIDQMTLPVPVQRTGLYRFSFNGSEVGAVRTALGMGSDTTGPAIVVNAQGVFQYGENARADCSIEQSAGAVFERATCTQIDPRGEHRFTLALENGAVVLSGQKGDGEEIRSRVAYGEAPLVITGPLMPGLHSIARSFDTLAVGASADARVIVLDTQGGEFRLIAETWSARRVADREGRRTLEASVRSPLGDYAVVLELDDEVIAHVTFNYQMGVVTVEEASAG